MRIALWLIAVVGYVVQIKCISHIYSTSVQGTLDVLYFLFAHCSSWILVAPLTQVYYYVRYGKTNRREIWNMGFWVAIQDYNIGSDAEAQMQGASKVGRQVKRALQFAILAGLISIAGYTFLMSLNLSPALDIAIIHNTSMFEIVSLLLVVTGLASRRHLLQNFLMMVVILIGILIVSYTKATCDVLSGKLSINQDTGELNDPFLFDRLKGALICGLGALTIGPVFVLWSKWTANAKNTKEGAIRPFTTSRDRNYVSNCEISLVGVFNLMILGTALLVCGKGGSGSQTVMYKSEWILVSIFAGHLPMVVATVHLSRRVSPIFTSTCFIGCIVFTALADWIAESAQSIITRWEVIGYLMVSITGIFLGRRYLATARFK